MSVRSQPKASMRTRLPNGDYLTLAVWQSKSDPTAEVITVQIRHLSGDRWETARAKLPTMVKAAPPKRAVVKINPTKVLEN